jgi:uncharacterized RDD family membrane protein YckC
LGAAFEVLGNRGAYEVKEDPAPAPVPAAIPYAYPQQQPYAAPVTGQYAQQPTVYVPGYASPAGAGVLGYGTYRYAEAQPNYAGFWIRFGAAFIDGIIMRIATFIVEFVCGVIAGAASGAQTTSGGTSDAELVAALVAMVVAIVVEWLYFALMTASKHQATLGKLACGLRVTDVNGNRLTFARATGRHFARMLSGLICAIGFIMAAFDERKRALHDQIAGTYVVYK